VAVFVRSVSARPVSGTGNGETKQPAILMVTVDSSTRRKGCTRAYEGGVGKTKHQYQQLEHFVSSELHHDQ
jgi:hypothetical protein